MEKMIAELRDSVAGQILINEPLSRHTTWKIGGPADIMIIPNDRDSLVRTMQLLYVHHMPWTVIGKGSNTLVADKGIRGAVIKLGQALDYMRIDDGLVYAGGSYSFIKLCIMTGKAGLTGLEFAGGIPGTVGGAVYMNAGAHGSDVSHVLTQADVLSETGEMKTYQATDLQYAYRHSALQDKPGIVTEAVFQLQPGDRKKIAAALAVNKQRRLQTQPLQFACAGSVFRNPENQYAAKLIEESGLKGMREGGAEVSNLHANFIVNTGNASAENVLMLIKKIQSIIEGKHGIRLVPEVLVVGER